MEPAAPAALVDVADVAAIRNALTAADPEGRLQPMLMRRIEIGPDALGTLPAVVGELSRGPLVAVLMDDTPIARGSRSVKEIVLDLLGDDFQPFLQILEGSIHADEETIARTARELRGCDCIVVVGSGTVTDIAKEASRLIDLPLVAVQTAGAVNAFSDNMAVLLQSGVKRTSESKWPDALVADLSVIAGAPASMTLAGFGDMCGQWTAPADWYLASILGMDDSYHPAPLALLAEPSARMLAAAPGLRHGELAAVDSLIRMLTISGIALGVAGSTAPLSGTEHLISHLIDLDAEVHGRPTALHGAQVGVASVLAAAIWELCLEEIDRAAPLPSEIPAADEVEGDLRAAFAGLDPTGHVAAECWRDCSIKLDLWREHRRAAAAAMSAWDSHRDTLATLLAPPEQIAEALRAAGAITSFKALSPSVSSETVRWAVRSLPFIRKRFTVADLLYYTGRWTDDLVDSALERASKAGIAW